MSYSVLSKLKEIMDEKDLAAFEQSIKECIQEEVEKKTKEMDEKYSLLSEEYLAIEKAKLVETLNEEYKVKLEESVNELEDKIVSSLDGFLDSEITENISDEVFDKVAINEVAMPIVENIKKLLEESYIPVNSDGSKLLTDKDAKIAELTAENDKHIAESIEYKELAEKGAKMLLLKEKTDGLTVEQKERVMTVYESKSFDEIESKIDDYVKLICEDETENADKTEGKNDTTEKKVEINETKVEGDGIDDKKVTITEDKDPLMTEVNRLLVM
jgi:hypothetical protein